MHRPLFVRKPLRTGNREHAFVPDFGVDVESVVAVDKEAHELVRSDVVAGPGEGNEKRATIEREEELSAVGVVIGVPKQQPFRPA